MRESTFDLVRLPEYRARVEALNKRAAKLHVAPITFTVVARDDRPRGAFPGDSERIPTVTLSIEGGIPKLDGGWSALGVIRHEKGGNIVATLADEDRVEAYRTAGPNCDHCKLARRRIKTVILVAEDGRVVQVGASCLKDFLGYGIDPDWLVQRSDLLASLDDDDWGGPSYPQPETIDTEWFVTAVAASHRTHGFSPADSALPTKSEARYVASGSLPRAEKSRDGSIVNQLEIDRVAEVNVTDVDKATARTVIDWARGLTAEGGYLGNLHSTLNDDELKFRYAGLAASAVQAWEKATDRAVEREAVEAAQPEPAPVVEGRIVIEGEVLSTKYVDSAYGETIKQLVLDDRGFKVWGTVPASLEPHTEWDDDGQVAVPGVVRGDRVRFTATVEASNDDPSFGFYKRPTKAEILKEVAA